MNMIEFYEKIGGDFSATLERLGTETLIRRVVLKFPEDTSFPQLCEGFEKHDAETAFRGAHTLKGVCSNLGFDDLYATVYELTEKLRGRTFDGAEPLFEETKAKYNAVVAAIAEIG